MRDFARPEWRRYAVGALFVACDMAATLAFPRFVGLVIDQAVQAARDGRAAWLAAGMFSVLVARAVSESISRYQFLAAGEAAAGRARGALFASLIQQEIAFFDRSTTGALASRLSADTAALRAAFGRNLYLTVRHVLYAAGAGAVLLHSYPRLTLVAMVVGSPLVWVAYAGGGRIKEYARRSQDAFAAASEVADDAIGGVRTVRAFSAETRAVARHAAAIGEAVAAARRATANALAVEGGTTIVAKAAMVVVIATGARAVATGQLTVGGLMAFLLYADRVSSSLEELSLLLGEHLRAAGATARIAELIRRTPAMPLDVGEEPGPVAGAVRFEDVSFSYPSRKDVPILRRLDLSLEPGEAVALVGPSGSGKSTVARLLSRFYDPDAGRVLLDGRDIRALKPSSLRRLIATVEQEPVLFATTIEENLRLGREDASPAEMLAAVEAANVGEFLRSLPAGLGTPVGDRGVQLSAGQKQRIAIARALLKDPRILILDEATSALDAESERLIQEALQRLMEGRTTLIIAHRLSTVLSADRVALIDGGRVAQSGTHERLFAEGGLYRDLVAQQLVAASIGAAPVEAMR